MTVLACDPGYEQSALVMWDGTKIGSHRIVNNEALMPELRWLGERKHLGITFVIEQIESMGMAVGKTTFETVYWSGCFAEAMYPNPVARVTRRAVKLHICGQSRAKDGEIRQAIIDRFGPSKEQAIGKKASKGPLYGIASHEWAALAVALTYYDLHADEPMGELVRPGVHGEF